MEDLEDLSVESVSVSHLHHCGQCEVRFARSFELFFRNGAFLETKFSSFFDRFRRNLFPSGMVLGVRFDRELHAGPMSGPACEPHFSRG